VSIEQRVSVPTLLITGTVGVGKSTVAAEINDVLADLKIPNAAVDLDALVWQWPSTSSWNSDLMFENLASLWPNYQAHGATRLILARVLEDRTELVRYRAAVPSAEITVCRLTAPEAVRLHRLHGRMPAGPSRDWHLGRTVELERVLDRLACEDFAVENGDRPVREVALEVLARAGWVSSEDIAPHHGITVDMDEQRTSALRRT
jgi:predicted kinase